MFLKVTTSSKPASDTYPNPRKAQGLLSVGFSRSIEGDLWDSSVTRQYSYGYIS